MAKSLLSLGSNLGDSKALISDALEDINRTEGVTVLKQSSLYITKPVGFLDQDDFVNAAALVETSLDAHELLKAMQSLEQKYKRVRLFKDGPRTLDIDIIAYDEVVMNTDDLILPHPRMHERAFVLSPLNEIVPDYQVSLHNKNISELYEALDEKEKAGAKKLNG
ncbi:MAG: 2-amino-4-hydroxy-6-hydroxymethyldihydropteridine diphosphokinase [Succinivibrio sp.]|jgi:2-amino-4-hydroxy-6-hydroxymethyldihydropteridine diphosphokinase|nr:2-amino-4-hydroxy-6-hydroxymethyldihydropteridine diphosphokinase [Succinivibrio sp.]MBR1612002.1 2-amino-4-hydroxy-6-hydroxymethyldihydropteridine diphosphokinase [Succinivibrio sp.]